MRLYHGSYCKITKVDLRQCRLYKDFGAGFYLTPDFGRAVTMANRSVILNDQGTPEVNPFLFYKSKCPPDLRIREFKCSNWEWVEFVMKNRDKSFSPPYDHGYDIVIGPVADSNVDAEIAAYKNEYGTRYLAPDNLRVLAQRLKYTGKYLQYCFCTERALEQLIKD